MPGHSLPDRCLCLKDDYYEVYSQISRGRARGSNFTSKTFAAAICATLKSLLRAYCVEMKREWEDGLPWLLLAARAVVQESTGFSSNDLVFGHKVRTSLSVLSSDLNTSEPPRGLADYVNGFLPQAVFSLENGK